MFNARKALYEFMDDPEVREIARREAGSRENLQFNFAYGLLKEVQPMIDAGDYTGLVAFLEEKFDYTADNGQYDESDVALALLTAVRHYLDHN